MFLNKIGLKSSNLDYKKEVNKSLDDFADLIEDNINVSEIFDMAN
jgi:cobyric acid synthase